MSINQYVSAFQEQEDIEQMRSGIRKWTVLYILFIGASVLAFYTFFGQNVNFSWVALLMIAALLAWIIRIPAMYIVLGTMLGWAALMNLFGSLTDPDQLKWFVIASLKALFFVILIVQYRKFNHLHPQGEENVLVNFGKASGILSILCMILPIVSCIGLFTYVGLSGDINSATPSPQNERLMEIFFTNVFIFADIAVFALGLGIAATTVKGHPKGWAIAGVVMSSVVIAGYIGFLMVVEFLSLLEKQGMLPTGG